MIPDLRELTLTQRAIIAFLIVVSVLFILAAIGYLSGGWDEAQGQPQLQLFEGIEFDEILLPIDKTALDEAYRGHLIKLWNVWLTDGAREATYFTNGLKIARQSYHTAKQQIERRERQLRDKRK